MFENHRKSPFIALIGAVALMTCAPAFAQDSSAPGHLRRRSRAASEAAAPAASDAAAPPEPITIKNAGKLTPVTMFLDAEPLVKVVMIGLLLASLLSWTLMVTKMLEFGGSTALRTASLEAFRGARSIADMGRIASSEDFEGNPMADMAAAAAQEVELSRQAGLQVSGAHRDSTILRAQTAVNAVQASLSRRLSSGMQFLASVGSNAPFIGLFAPSTGSCTRSSASRTPTRPTWPSWRPASPKRCWPPASVCSRPFRRLSSTTTSRRGSPPTAAVRKVSVAELLNAISRQLDRGA